MQIHLNGEIKKTQSTTLAGLIDETGFDQKALIAELNFDVIKQDQWDKTTLKEGDQIELLSFVGGG